MPEHYYVEDHEDGPLRANGAGGPPRTDKQPLIVAAPLSHGSNPNSNMAGRRREDDENLVAYIQGGAQQDQFCSPDGVSPTLAHASNTHHGHHQPKILNGASVRRLTPTECERLQGLPDGWTLVNGAADSRRYAALGDAVTVPVAEWIGQRILAMHHRQEGSTC